MKIVIDLNVFISAYLRGGIPREVTKRYARRLDTLYITDDIIAEIKNTLKKPKLKMTQDKIDGIIAAILTFSEKITVLPQHRASGVCRHSKDDKYIECALAAQADCIISGDNDLLTLKEYKGIKMMKPREFLDAVGD
ncbi:MAG: putative toxin-antitoxin system toxin component, PIN family [Chitinispirillia bacterium]|nr:putative toxin-antitoxin system toxin component, PIN family [Chitinispirillia bacterium]